MDNKFSLPEDSYSTCDFKGCLISIVVLFAIILLIIGSVFGPQIAKAIEDKREKAGPETSFFTAMFKEKPSIDVNPAVEVNDDRTLIYLGVEFIVSCEEDYDEIVILLALKDSNDVVFKQEYITFTNCEAGKKYSKTCTFTAEEILKAKGLNGGLYKYK